MQQNIKANKNKHDWDDILTWCRLKSHLVFCFWFLSLLECILHFKPTFKLASQTLTILCDMFRKRIKEEYLITSLDVLHNN